VIGTHAQDTRGAEAACERPFQSPDSGQHWCRADGEYIRRARRTGLSWPLPDGLTDDELERCLFPPPTGTPKTERPQPDWPVVHRELRRTGVTLSLLWEEYRLAHPDGYGYSRFCELYRRWEGRLSPTMRQVHIAGERMFVDYAGATLDVINPQTGEVRSAQLFVATLGASSYTFADATWTQSLADWTGSHVRALEFFGGVPRQIVSDNLKAGITKACFYEPTVNRTYADLPESLKDAGQPVLIGGSMGTGSFVLAGTTTSEAKAFSSACHGAGRKMSRHKAYKMWRGRQVVDHLADEGIIIRSPSSRGVAEEAPGAYKDVTAVVDAAESAGLARKVARLKPIVCAKG